MKTKFLEYSFEQLLEEKSFISWVLEDDKNEEWIRFLELHPEFRLKADEAREVIKLLRDKFEILDKDSILDLWRSIDRYDQLHNRNVRRLKIIKSITIAASVVLIFILGIYSYNYLIVYEQDYKWSTSLDFTEKSKAFLILSSGDKIALGKDNPTIIFDEKNTRVIINDSIIDISQKTGDQIFVTKMNEVVIPYGKRCQLLLADGTQVWLNAGSRLAFPSKYTKGTREVFLDGEACFKVAKKESNPFVVKAGQINVKVLGTHFNVTAYPSDNTIETVLIEGSVAVDRVKSFSLKKTKAILEGKQRASYHTEKNEFIVREEPEAEFYIAWTYGWLQYSRESLESVLEKLEKYYNVEFRFAPGFTATDEISGKLELKKSLEDVLEIFADASSIDFRIIGNEVYIENKIKEILH